MIIKTLQYVNGKEVVLSVVSNGATSITEEEKTAIYDGFYALLDKIDNKLVMQSENGVFCALLSNGPIVIKLIEE